MAKLAKLNGNYVYTRDNFIKSVIILMKIKASIPVILMGETGCGKTSLLKMLSIFMNEGSEKMKTLNVHAVTNQEDIINFMNEVVLNNLEKDLNDELNKIMERFDSDENAGKYNREKYLEEQKDKLKKKSLGIFR
jgi:ABC-type lipoprotein export system ATPase subunit